MLGKLVEDLSFVDVELKITVVTATSKYFNEVRDNYVLVSVPLIVSTLWFDWLFLVKALSIKFSFIFPFARTFSKFDRICFIGVSWMSSSLWIELLDTWE